jgi:GT2 family glycosyltransferase
MSAAPTVWAVVPVRDRRALTVRFLEAWRREAYEPKRIVVVDDGSSDGTAEELARSFPEVAVLRGDGNLWWAGATNLGVRHALAAGADHVLTINDDALVEPGFLAALVDAARADPLRIVGSRIHREPPDDRLWAVGVTRRFRGNRVWGMNHAGERWEDVAPALADPQPVDTLCGNGTLVPRQAFADCGLYDDRRCPQYHADSDFVLRAAARGYRPVVALGSVVRNHDSGGDIPKRRWDIVFSRKSPLYWRALWTILRRHGPRGRRLVLFIGQYLPQLLPRWLVALCRRLLGRSDAVEPQAPSRT